MSDETLNTVGTYLIALVVIVGAFAVIWSNKGDLTLPYSAISLIVGWIVRDNAGSSATTNAVKTIAASIPTTTVVTGPGAPPLGSTVTTSANPTGGVTS